MRDTVAAFEYRDRGKWGSDGLDQECRKHCRGQLLRFPAADLAGIGILKPLTTFRTARRVFHCLAAFHAVLVLFPQRHAAWAQLIQHSHRSTPYRLSNHA